MADIELSQKAKRTAESHAGGHNLEDRAFWGFVEKVAEQTGDPLTGGFPHPATVIAAELKLRQAPCAQPPRPV